MTTNTPVAEKFSAAVNVIKNLPKNGPFQPSDEMKLLFYSYYKQATEGPCKESKPGFWEVVKRAKWEAWMRLGDMTKEDAMNSYVEELKKIVETMSYTEDVAKFVEKLGPFYEMVDIALPVNKDKIGDGKSFGDFNVPQPKENGWANGVPHLEVNEKVSNTQNSVKIPETFTSRDAISEKFYSGTESDDEEFSDPVPNYESEFKLVTDDIKFVSDAAIVSGEELHSNIENQHVWASFHLKKDQINRKKEDSIDMKINGFSENRGEFDMSSSRVVSGVANNEKLGSVGQAGVTLRGGGDPMASSTGRGYRGVNRQPSTRLGNTYSGGSLNLPSSSGRLISAGSGGGHRQGPGGGFDGSDVNQQIAETLFKLQRDMESVLTRLSTLEALTVANHNITHGRMVSVVASETEPSFVSWWPFRNISFKAVAIFLAWPVVLQVVIYLILARRSRRAVKQCLR